VSDDTHHPWRLTQHAAESNDSIEGVRIADPE
jgi:hypothetical protein